MKVNNRIGMGHYFVCYSHYYLSKLQYENALRFARRALKEFGDAKDRDDIVLMLVQVAVIRGLQGAEDESRHNVLKAQAIYEKIHCEYLKPFLLFAKGMLARSTRSDDAKAVLTEALRTSRKIGTREITWQIQREFALHHRDLGEPHKALAYYRDAVETIKQITESIDEEELKASYLEVPFRKRVFEEIKELKKQTKKAG
jgi:tetratricopeptide (TPR) repeat protein